MKRLTSRADSPSASNHRCRSHRSALILLIIATFGLTSCIFDSPGDAFYRTLWLSEEKPFSMGAMSLSSGYDTTGGSSSGTSSSGNVILEFLCGGNISVRASGSIGSYGTYEPHGTTAYFSNLRLTHYNGNTPIVIVLEEAHRTNDLLLISWHYEGSNTSYTTRLVRKSSYDQLP